MIEEQGKLHKRIQSKTIGDNTPGEALQRQRDGGCGNPQETSH